MSLGEGAPIIIKKKKVHGHGHHGGAWKVAYADFVTSMMAFFMVLWIMGLSDETRQAIQGYFNDPLGFMRNQPKTTVNINPRGELSTSRLPARDERGDSLIERSKEAQFRERLRRTLQEAARGDPALRKLVEGIVIHSTPEGLELEFVETANDAFFAIGCADLTPGARRILARLAPVLVEIGRPMIIDGHTDARPYPSRFYDNWDLSTDRAAAFRRALAAGGVPDDRILMVRGNADRRLKKPEDPYSFLNRRVSLILPSDVDKAIRGLPETELRQHRESLFSPILREGPGPSGPVDLRKGK